MTTTTVVDQRTAPAREQAPTVNEVPPQVQGWVAAFQRDEPMYKSFPLVLPNGAKIKTFTGICSSCKEPVNPELVRGRVMWSLPTVATVEGNSYCEDCQRITHHDCRFRAEGNTYRAEWPGLDGRWYSKTPPVPTLLNRVLSLLKGKAQPAEAPSHK